MTRWHESLSAGLGLRAGGVAMLDLGGGAAIRLHQLAMGVPAREPTLPMLPAIRTGKPVCKCEAINR